MNNEQFNQILEEEFDACRSVLAGKASEYASDIDRLSNFRKAAVLSDETMAEALAGMMKKHTISIYDMIDSGAQFTEAQWNEKIRDHINYLLLLKAVVVEEQLEPQILKQHPIVIPN